MTMRISAIFAYLSLASSSALAFTSLGTFANVQAPFSSSLRMHEENNKIGVESFDPLQLTSLTEDCVGIDIISKPKYAMTSLAVAAVALSPTQVNAAGPDWGIFEGRTGSLLHPLTMGGLLLFSLSTGLKGFQYRRQRTIGDEIKDLKKTLPSLNGAKSLAEAITAAETSGETNASELNSLKAALPIQNDIDALNAERKELSSMKLKDSHFSQGSMLAFVGTAFAIEGPLNTYARAGKLFPGPHLYAGAGLVVLWAAAAACVPQMQKGNDTARSIHIGANVIGTGLFAWQVVSGIPILLKVVEKTSWP